MRPKENKIKLEKILVIRVSEKLHKKLCAVALSSGKSVSDVIRLKIMDIRIPDMSSTILTSQVLQLKNELRRQGGLLKHCINTMNAIGETPEVLTEIKQIANGYENLEKEALKIFQRL